MIARRMQLLVTSVAIFLCAFGVAAQQCTKEDTTQTCWDRINPTLKAETEKAVAKTNTGTPTATTSATANALRDFLSVFAAGIDTGGVTENGTSVTLDWNKDERLKFQTVFSDPTLAKDVQTPLASNADAAKSKLSNFDDATMLIAYSPVTNFLGRSIARHTDLLNNIERADEIESAKKNQIVAELWVKSGLTSFGNDTRFDTIANIDARAQLISAVEGAATAYHSAVTSSSSVVKALTQLINNQPQAYAQGSYHARDALIGQDEWSLKGTYEYSQKSLNAALGDKKTVHCDEVATGKANKAQATSCAEELIKFAAGKSASRSDQSDSADPATQPDAGDRYAFAIEYKRAGKESVDLSTYKIATPVLRPGTHSIVYSITYGHPLSGSTLKDARFDVAINYDNVSGDPKKTDRLVASVTYSHKVSDKLTPLLSLTYANHADYLPQTDHKLGVHFGLSYKIPSK